MTLTTRLAIAMIALVAVAVSAVGWLSYRSLEQALLPRVLDRIETHSRLVATDLESHVRSARGDIAGFRGLAAVHGLMRARNRRDRSDRRHHRRGSGANGWRHGWPPRSKPSRPMHAPLHRRRGRRPGNRSRRSLGTERRGSDRPGSGTEAESATQPTSGTRSGWPRTRFMSRRSIWVAENGVIEDGAQADPARRDAGLCSRRQAVRHRHRQCRHAARARPRPVIGAARRDDLCRRRPGRLSRSSRSHARIRLAARQAYRLASATFRIWRAGSAQRKAAPRSCRTRPAGPDGDRVRARRSGRQRMGRGHRDGPATRSSWRRRRASETPRCWSELIAVLCAAVLALLIARSLTRPIVQLTEAVQGVARRRQGRHSGRCERRDRRARARICASDGGSECKDRRARTRG